MKQPISAIDTLKSAVATLKKEVFTQGLLRKALVFSYENSKLKGIYTFSLPSGHTCPGASICLAKVDRATGKLTDGPKTTVRCFSASQEAVYPTVRAIRWHNFDLLQQAKGAYEKAALIIYSLPTDAKIVRIHVAGDFYSQEYFAAWKLVAEWAPNITFYAYTKSLPYWANTYVIPENLKLNASLGGKFDGIASQLNLKSARIVFSEAEAAQLDLEIDEDDSHAYLQDKSFALLVHGTQPPGSVASKAWSQQLQEIKKFNAAQPQKIKRTVPPLTVERLAASVLRLTHRLIEILKQPVFTVSSLKNTGVLTKFPRGAAQNKEAAAVPSLVGA